MSQVTRFGPDPTLDLEVANKRYVDAGGGGANTQIFGNAHHRDVIGAGDEFFAFNGIAGGAGTAADQQILMIATGILSLLSLQLSVNTSLVTNTFTTFINASVGNLTISIGAGLTGFFQDTVNTDMIVSEDLVCSEWTFTSGTGVSIDASSVLMTYS